ncbi:amidase signature enzyme [Lentithecium fluviatile CBS 122367]|uniref:Amidase signature enzyme n=1 Tax=Lentithecium fluviatile CBS 122367 TaxID=1168545 RepID=A0A6G1IVB1_9PLEO|nr:amidase signature enzyme [Lentithecium fluviatile CBS 122367]
MTGTKNTLCSKAWRDLYPASSQNAPTIQSLLDKGAIVIGKTKLNAMIVHEETMECVDCLAPFNPRGDGYQTSGSSSGSCAALGAYDWADISIGSDTNRSCRKLAHWNGVFAIRPTHECSMCQFSLVVTLLPFLLLRKHAQTEVIESFIKGLEAELSVKRTGVLLAEEWKKFRPSGVEEGDVAVYLEEERDCPYLHCLFDPSLGWNPPIL